MRGDDELRPVFLDYLYLGLTNAVAFSPTDVMPLAHWAKLTMSLESLTSLTILALVARSRGRRRPRRRPM